MNKKLQLFSILMISTAFICKAQLVDPQSPTDIKPDLNFENLPNSSKAENWDLVFSDEFNDTEMDPEKWNIQYEFSK